MNQLVLFGSLLPEQAVAVPAGFQSTQHSDPGEGNATFSDVLAKMLKSAKPQEAFPNDKLGFPMMSQPLDPVPLSFLFADETTEVEDPTSLYLPASALSEDSSGRLLVSLRELSAILEKLDQAGGGGKSGEPVALKKILPIDDNSLDRASLSPEGRSSC